MFLYSLFDLEDLILSFIQYLSLVLDCFLNAVSIAGYLDCLVDECLNTVSSLIQLGLFLSDGLD